MPRTGTPILRKDSKCALPTNPKPITAAICFIIKTLAYASFLLGRFHRRLQGTSFQTAHNRNFGKPEIWTYLASGGRMLGKEIPVSTPQRKFWHIVIVLAACTVVAVPSGADDAASGLVDSQTFLHRNLTPAGPPASASATAVEKLLGQMTLKEKIGQMTQLEIGMVTDGRGQSIRINSEQLHKAVGEYGVGSILNVNDEALSPEKWHEIIGDIQAEAKKSRLQIPVLYGIDTIHGPNYIVAGTLFPQPPAMAASGNR